MSKLVYKLLARCYIPTSADKLHYAMYGTLFYTLADLIGDSKSTYHDITEQFIDSEDITKFITNTWPEHYV